EPKRWLLNYAPLIFHRQANDGIRMNLWNRHGDEEIGFVEEHSWQRHAETTEPGGHVDFARWRVRKIHDANTVTPCKFVDASAGEDFVHGEAVVATGIGFADGDVRGVIL